jgi:3-isopropylmalate/(R)-2-methylmalate dehydratase large subunit
LKMIGTMGTAGGSGHVLEYGGEAVRALSMEGRMTICNMSIEAGARAGMIAPDDTTFDYITGRERAYAPTGEALDAALAYWRSLPSDADARFDQTLTIDTAASHRRSPGGPTPAWWWMWTSRCPPGKRQGIQPLGCKKCPGLYGAYTRTRLTDVPLDVVFIGSCTNSRIEDLRQAAAILDGRKKADHVELLVVPGSHQVRLQAEAEGLDRIFKAAGGQWRYAGCSMCLGMNPDQLQAPAALRLHLQPQF